MNRCLLVCSFVFCSGSILLAQGTKADYERAAFLRVKYTGKLFGDKVEPRWFENGKKFWYDAKRPDGKTETVLVDVEAVSRTVVEKSSLPKEATEKAAPPAPQGPRPRRSSARSPDGKWQAVVRDHDVILVDQNTKSEAKLTTDGKASDGFNGTFYWSPDSKRLIAYRLKPAGERKITYVESSPSDQVQPKTSTSRLYLKPGDDVNRESPRLFDVSTKKEIPVSTELFANPWTITDGQWTADSKQFRFLYNQRGHQVMRVVAIDGETGKVDTLVNEECKTFFDYSNKTYLRYLPESNELVWMSERTGWNHLYRIDADTKKATPITKGEWLVRGVDHFDPEKKQITFRACGFDANQDPYHVHHCRINFDGTGFTRLTEGDGTHTLQWSPDRRFYLDTYSLVDRSPVTELRQAEDGKKLLTLEESSLDRLKALGWKGPERFVAKGRDGETEIHGIIHRPSNFDPAKKYPVIEYIYAGPHGHHVPKEFRAVSRTMEMTELGFIVVQIDGMGTNWRSKAFHDVCWKNIGDSGFPDRIAWIKAAAAKYPQMDLSKGVGIYGGSAGGQSTVRGMTEYPDFYTVGVADCGCHDNRMDKIWWNEAWMGWPVGDHYKEQSNMTNAYKIKGKLFLTVGELDSNVDPASTMQLANALIRANKDFDLLIVPGANHGAGESPYADRRRKDFFVRHLLGVDPRNEASGGR